MLNNAFPAIGPSYVEKIGEKQYPMTGNYVKFPALMVP